jgi:hypothetical protein
MMKAELREAGKNLLIPHGQNEDREFYLLKPALEHAFWVAAWVALPLAAWLVIASQLFGHRSERARATRAYRADFESKMVSDGEGGLVF